MAYNPYYQNPYIQPMFNQNGAMPDAFNQMKAPYQNQPMQPTQMSASNNNDMIWVLNEVEAQSFPVAPNNTVILWDKSNPTIYIKSANAQGVPSIRTLDFTERAQNMPQNAPQSTKQNVVEFVTVEQLNDLKGKYDEILTRIQTLEEKPKAKTIKKGDAE